MLAHGVPIHVVSELLGHSDIRLTINTYGKGRAEALREGTEALGRALSR
jgi:site-specific recombinase XerD